MQTDKGQFDSVLSRMLSTPPKKEADIKSPKPSRQKSDQQSEEAQPDRDGEPSV